MTLAERFCDGNGPHTTDGELRVIPMGSVRKAVLCKACADRCREHSDFPAFESFAPYQLTAREAMRLKQA